MQDDSLKIVSQDSNDKINEDDTDLTEKSLNLDQINKNTSDKNNSTFSEVANESNSTDEDQKKIEITGNHPPPKKRLDTFKNTLKDFFTNLYKSMRQSATTAFKFMKNMLCRHKDKSRVVEDVSL
ncbi:hypothetical protein EDEG_03615 [Edhazardia aedis USNM 41457]|uniref:Uncharacterized protein n=1 Tax=Edhazardia aedis (strain USNM 41457) TaxID=1003232 RepID=J8ZQD9_EDHAE|nr:hypothetical protein EDEG_03615 [Edhazardia aedis USNM 41457]|eukprot:EJW01913.1 hypothetical protein EDEG_03615 [Edhazardia aedis USNM 41457]